MQRVYITLRGDDKIAIYNLDPADGALSHQEQIHVPGGPSLFALSPNGAYAYVGLREHFKLTSFKINSRTGSLATTGTADLNSDHARAGLALVDGAKDRLSTYNASRE